MSCGNNKGKCLETTSSSCVIWDGPDIKCLGLCRGDTVTDVVYKAAKLLCELLDKFDISLLDFECYVNENPKPQDIQELLQWIISKLCELKEQIENTQLNIDCNYVKQNIYSCAINFSFCDSEGNPQNYSLPLYSETTTSFVSLLSDIICIIRGDINDIKQDIVNINTQINYILNNCCNEGGGSGGFTLDIVPNECVYPSSQTPPSVINTNQQLEDYLDNIAQMLCCVTGVLGYDVNTLSSTRCNIGCRQNNYIISGEVSVNPCDPNADSVFIGQAGDFLNLNICNYKDLVDAVEQLYNMLFNSYPLNSGVMGLVQYLHVLSLSLTTCLTHVQNEITDCHCRCTRLSNPRIHTYPLTGATNSFANKKYKFKVVVDNSSSYSNVNVGILGSQTSTNDDSGNTITSTMTYNNVSDDIAINVSPLNVNPFSLTSQQFGDYIYHNITVEVVLYDNQIDTCRKYNNIMIEDKYYTCGPVIEFGAYTIEPIT